jgi:hypothetical protein
VSALLVLESIVASFWCWWWSVIVLFLCFGGARESATALHGVVAGI